MRDAFGVENPTISKREGKGRDAAYGAAGAAGGAAAGAVGMTAREGVRGAREAKGAVTAAKEAGDWQKASRGSKATGVAQIAANPAYRKLLKPKTAAVAGGASLLAGGAAAAAHHKLSKRLPSALRAMERLGTTYTGDALRGMGPRAQEVAAAKVAAHRSGQAASRAHAGAGKTPEFAASMKQAGLRPGSDPFRAAQGAAGQKAAEPAINAGRKAAAEAKAPVERSNRAIEQIHNDANDLAVNGRMARAKLDRAAAAQRRRNLKIVGGVAGASAAGGAGVLGYDYVKGRNKSAKVQL